MRINLYAGPGSGKSTIAAYVFSHLKMQGCSIEHINEYIKEWAYEKRNPQGCDQFYIFAKQWRKEDIALRNGVSHIITDSPLGMQCMYAMKYGAEEYENILSTAFHIEWRKDVAWKSINILLKRVHGEYQQSGRFQDFQQAIEMDNYIKENLDAFKFKYVELPNDPQEVFNYCQNVLKG